MAHVSYPLGYSDLASHAAQLRRSLAVVIPVWNEEQTLPELLRRLTAACDSVAELDWQAIFVDDGSQDQTLSLLLAQRTHDPRIKVVRLSRNFGHQPAITAGLAHAEADAVVIMDADLQDPPELIPELVDAWDSGAEVVLAQRRTRRDRGVRGLGFRFFHRTFSWISDFPMPRETGVFGLIGGRALEEFHRFTERNRFFPGLRSWIGFEQRVVLYDRDARAAGEPKQTLGRLVRYAMDGVLSFSYKPLRLMSLTGATLSLLAIVVACILLGKGGPAMDASSTGFGVLAAMVAFMGGVQLMGMGLIGAYLGRVHDEVKNRPLFIVRESIGFDTHASKIHRVPWRSRFGSDLEVDVA